MLLVLYGILFVFNSENITFLCMSSNFLFLPCLIQTLKVMYFDFLCLFKENVGNLTIFDNGISLFSLFGINLFTLTAAKKALTVLETFYLQKQFLGNI